MKHKWTLLPQEVNSTEYTFSGKIFVTARIKNELSVVDISYMLSILSSKVIALGGLDYLQVFKNETGQKVFIIDNLSKRHKEIASKEYVEENDYYTVMFADEY